MNEQKRTGYLPKSAHPVPSRSAIPFVLSRHMPKLLDLCSIGLGHHVTNYQGDTTLHGTMEWRIFEGRWESEEFTLRGTGLAQAPAHPRPFRLWIAQRPTLQPETDVPSGGSTGAVRARLQQRVAVCQRRLLDHVLSRVLSKRWLHFLPRGLRTGYGNHPASRQGQRLCAHPGIHRYRERRAVGLEEGARVSAPLLRSAEYSNEKEAWPTTSGPLPNP